MSRIYTDKNKMPPHEPGYSWYWSTTDGQWKKTPESLPTTVEEHTDEPVKKYGRPSTVRLDPKKLSGAGYLIDDVKVNDGEILIQVQSTSSVPLFNVEALQQLEKILDGDTVEQIITRAEDRINTAVVLAILSK